jgi:hypothetical protein
MGGDHWKGWESCEWPGAGWDLENCLPAGVPRPQGTMVGHAWINEDGEIIEHWISEQDADDYYRYIADEFMVCAGAIEEGEPAEGCQIFNPAPFAWQAIPDA